ncbi:hypothetical protein C7271_20150 [filamentous cyanobacterium CCP5]|nr:hypothetical protein C7271_20150 [filamentous cyanobacterium CCP5]
MVAFKRAPLLVGSGVLLLLGAGLTAWYLASRSHSGQGLPTGAQAIPPDSPLVVSLSTDARQWQRLRQYGTTDTQAEFDQLLLRWRDRLFVDGSLDFTQDIQPWIGSEITLVFLPGNAAPGARSAPLAPSPEFDQMVALLPIADGAAAQATWNPQSEAEPIQTYQGIDIFSLPAESANDAEPWYGALLGTNLFAVSHQTQLLERTIDAYKGKSLIDRPGLAAAFGRLAGSDGFARFYIDMPAAVDYLAERSQPPLTASPEAFSERGLVGLMALESRGIRWQGISWLEPGSRSTFNTAGKSSLMPQQLPRKTLLMASAANFQEFWQSFQQAGSLGALLPLNLPNLALGLEGATGLDVEADILPWLEGEFALGILAPDALPDLPDSEKSDVDPDGEAEAPASLPNPAIVAIAQVSDRPAAEQTFSQLDRVMGDRYGFTVKSETIEDHPLTQWVSPFEGLSLSHGWLSENLAFLTVGRGVPKALIGGPSLSTNDLFELTTRSAPNPNNGYFFVDLTAINAVPGSLLLPPLPEDGWIGSEAIIAIGVTATILDERKVRYDLFTVLNRGPNPGPLSESAPDDANPDPPDADSQGSEDETEPVHQDP